FQAEDGIRHRNVTGVQTCALPICFISLLNVLRDLIASDTGALEYSLNFSIISEETLSIFVAILYSGKTLSLLIISPPFFIIKILSRKRCHSSKYYSFKYIYILSPPYANVKLN